MIGRWFVGFVVFVGYLCLGAFVFYRIERKEEEKRHYLEIVERLELKDLLAKYYSQVNSHIRKQFIQQLNTYCNKTVLFEETGDEEEHQYQWTYYNAFFFALTTLSTIGYGNLHPTSATGRILVLVYSLIGIPLNGIVLTQLGSFFESRILRAHYSYKTQRMMGPQLSLIMDVVTYLIPGIIVFIFIPSYIISYFEGWTFDESVYFAFVTLTTIGYGDYVAGQTVNTDIWYNAYKVFLVCWIMFGLGYLFMILSFISRAMRSKTLEHLFLERLKHTHSKIWHQFTKDVVYIRRVLNESYLLKFKPVYKKEASSCGLPLRRSRSSPNLTEWPVLRKTVPVPAAEDEDEDEDAVRRRFEKHRMKRRRALSQNRMRSLLRRTKATSEIDLAHIDKEATFGADIASYEILSRVVDALETAVPNQPPTVHMQQQPVDDSGNFSKKKAYSFSEGVQGFSPEYILASEKNEWTVGGEMLNRENTFASKHRNSYFEYDTWAGAEGRNYKKFNEYSKNGNYPNNGHHHQPQQQQQSKSRVPKLRRMSAAAFNFLSNNIAPKWLTDRLADGGGGSGGGGGGNRTDNPKHRLSLNDDHGYGSGYGSTYNGAANHRNLNVYNHSHTVQTGHNSYGRPTQNQYGYNHNLTVQDNRGYRPDRGRRYDGNPAAAAYPQLQFASTTAAAQEPRNRRQSSPDPVLTHCANTIAVADFLMTLQRSLDNSSVSMQPHSAMSRRQERRSPLYTLFQDRRDSSSAESWQYSSMASTVSSSTNVGVGGGEDTTVTSVSGRLPPSSSSTAQLLSMPGNKIANTVLLQDPAAAAATLNVRQETKRPKKKRIRRFSIRPTAGAQHAEPERGGGWTTATTATTTTTPTAGGKDVRLDIED